MQITSYYPVLATSDVGAAQRFFEQYLGFEPRYESDWYVHLAHPGHEAVAVAVVASDHESIPAGGRTPAAGVLLTFEVDDVDAEYERLKAMDVHMLLSLRDEPWGQRHFIVRGPDKVLVDVVKPIAPSAQYAANYLKG